MKAEPKMITILLADDDPDDRKLTQDAFSENRLANVLDCVEDGEELLAYLHRSGKYETLRDRALPGLILLDLNLPRIDGAQLLSHIRKSDCFSATPVIVLTSSDSPKDRQMALELGANLYFRKPPIWLPLWIWAGLSRRL